MSLEWLKNYGTSNKEKRPNLSQEYPVIEVVKPDCTLSRPYREEKFKAKYQTASKYVQQNFPIQVRDISPGEKRKFYKELEKYLLAHSITTTTRHRQKLIYFLIDELKQLHKEVEDFVEHYLEGKVIQRSKN